MILDELPRVSYSPSSNRFIAKRYRTLQGLKKRLWEIYATKEKVMVFEKEPHQWILIKGIKMVKIIDGEETIYYAIDTSHDEYAEIGLPYVLRCLLADAEKLEDYDESKYQETAKAAEYNKDLD